MFTVQTHRTRFNRILPATLAGLLCSLMFSLRAAGQGLPSPGFEEWTGSGRQAPFNWVEPTGWKSTNPAMEFSGWSVVKWDEAHGGEFSCLIKTMDLFGTNYAGTIASGNPKLQFSTYSIDVLSGGTPISNRPDGLTGYYRFSSPTNGDYGYAMIILKKYNTAESQAEVVGMGQLRLDPVSSFTLFNVPVEYENEEQPDSVVVAFFSSDPSDTKAGGLLMIDDIALVTDGLGVADDDRVKSGAHVYPNPASGSIRVELESRKGGERTITFYDLLGREVMNERFDGSSTTMDLSLPAGLYTYRVIGEDEEFMGRIMIGR